MAGRPTKYKPEYSEQAKAMCWMGATDDDLAQFFKVSEQTINSWKTQFPEFLESLKSNKDYADDRVERALYQKAIGYEQDAVKVFMPAGAAEPVYAPYREKIAPDTTAAIFWLKNRRKDRWRDKQDFEVTGEIRTLNLSDNDKAEIAVLAKRLDDEY